MKTIKNDFNIYNFDLILNNEYIYNYMNKSLYKLFLNEQKLKLIGNIDYILFNKRCYIYYDESTKEIIFKLSF